MSKGTTITCQCCGRETQKRSNGLQKYCEKCSEIKDKERKRRWSLKNPTTNEYFQNRSKIIKQITNQKGIEINNTTRNSIFWIEESEEKVDFNTEIRIAIPFSEVYSKNALTSSRSDMGHKSIREQRNQLMSELVSKIKQTSRTIKWQEDKVWIDLFIQKPNHKFDAINFVTTICDSIKEAIQVDDKWFSIRKLDWQIIKENPLIFIGISQVQEGNKRTCSKCGRILHLEMFWKDSSDRFGIGRECKDCMTLKGGEL